jgi:hypothetical protein
MINFIKKKYECHMISKASKILMDRNAKRSKYTSRKDNNEMWYMAEKLEAIAYRINNNYKDL